MLSWCDSVDGWGFESHVFLQKWEETEALEVLRTRSPRKREDLELCSVLRTSGGKEAQLRHGGRGARATAATDFLSRMSSWSQ